MLIGKPHNYNTFAQRTHQAFRWSAAKMCKMVQSTDIWLKKHINTSHLYF